MPLTLIVETGAGIAEANSYASRAAGNQHHEARLHSAPWVAASDAEKDQALAMATRFLDANVTWQGQRCDIDQALAWPRKNAIWDGHEVPNDMLPRPVIAATCELARLLLQNDLQGEQTSDNIKSLNLGSSALEIEFKDESKTRRVPLAIGELLQGLGATTSGGGINTRKVTR